MVTEEKLKALKKELEGYKQEKIRAQVLLENINQEIKQKEEELEEAGITSQEDLDKMEKDIENRYDALMKKVETYRNAVK